MLRVLKIRFESVERSRPNSGATQKGGRVNGAKSASGPAEGSRVTYANIGAR